MLTINEYPPPGWTTPAERVVVDTPSKTFSADAEKIVVTVFATFELD